MGAIGFFQLSRLFGLISLTGELSRMDLDSDLSQQTQISEHLSAHLD
jgi:hypothetical protein